MTQRLTTLEIEEILKIGLDHAATKRFKGISPHTVTVSFEEAPPGEPRRAVLDAGPERDVVTIGSEEDLRTLADRVERLVYPDLERHLG